MRGRRSARWGLVACLAFGASGAGAATAAAATPPCGATITESTTLTADMDCSASPAIVIGADGVTLDLGGHTIAAAGVGISDSGYDDVSIRNGTIHRANVGISLQDFSRVAVTDITLDLPDGGILASAGDRLYVTRANTCPSVAFEAIALQNVTDAVIVDNRVCSGQGFGIDVQGSDRAIVEGNTVSKGQHYGVLVRDSDDVLVRSNRLTDNTVVGVAVISGARNVVERNLAMQNQAGIQVGSAATDTSVRDNVASLNLLGGYAGAPRDGIDVFSPSTVIAGNVANRNFGFGIYAPNGAIDGGGNHAHANGEPAQCVNVSC